MCSGIDESSLNRIVGLLENKESTLVDFLKEEKIIEALKRGITRVQEFFLSHISDLLKVISGEIASDSSSVLITAFSILTKFNIPYFTEKIYTSEVFLKWLSEFPSSPSVNSQNIVLYTKIIIQLGKSFYYCLNTIPNKQNFIPQLIRIINYSSVYNLLSLIVEDYRAPVMKFLKDVNATQQFLDHISDDQNMNLLMLHFARSIVELCDIGNPLLDTFMEEKTFNMLYNLIMNSHSQLVSQECLKIFNLVLILIATETPEERDEDAIYVTLFQMVKSKITEFCEFAMNSQEFGCDAVSTINLISLMIRLGLEIDDKIIDLGKLVFDKLVEKPAYSILHLSFLDLFIKISDDQQGFLKLVSECQLIKRIPEIFDDSEGKLWANLGVLFKMTGIIIKKIPAIEDADWESYVETKYEAMKRLTTARVKPTRREKLPSDDDALTKQEVFEMISEGSFISDDDDDEDYSYSYDEDPLSDYDYTDSDDDRPQKPRSTKPTTQATTIVG